MIITKDDIENGFDDFHYFILPAIVLATVKQDWETAAMILDAALSKGEVHQLEYVLNEDLYPEAVSMAGKRLSSLGLHAPKSASHRSRSPMQMLFSTFDNGGWLFDQGELSDEQRNRLLDIFDKIDLSTTATLIYPAAVANIRDEKFWRSHIERKPDVLAHAMSLESARLFKEHNGNVAYFASSGMAACNSALFKVCCDKEFIESAASKASQEIFKDEKNPFSDMSHALKTKVGAQWLAKVIDSNDAKSPVIDDLMGYVHTELLEAELLNAMIQNVPQKASRDKVNEFIRVHGFMFDVGFDSIFVNTEKDKEGAICKIGEQLLQCGYTPGFIAAKDFANTAGFHFSVGIDSLLRSESPLSMDEKCKVLNELAIMGYDFNSVLDEKRRTGAHKIAACDLVEGKMQLLLHAVTLGLDTEVKDSRNWSAASYLQPEEKLKLKAAQKAIKARDEAKQAVADIRASMAP